MAMSGTKQNELFSEWLYKSLKLISIPWLVYQASYNCALHRQYFPHDFALLAMLSFMIGW